MGRVRIPVARRYGAQTARAIANFGHAPLGFALGTQPHLVSSLLEIKEAAASANVTVGALDARRGAAIASACVSLTQESDLACDFPVHILHGGGGTSANMNANEVVAHMANTLAGKTSRRPIDPLDHVNEESIDERRVPNSMQASAVEASRATRCSARVGRARMARCF